MQPLVIAHRGASAYAKENTLISFDKAIALGADMVEFDVRRTRDRVLIIHHDAEINQKPIRQLTYAQVQAFDPDIPKLEEAIALCRGRVRLDVELKEAGYEKRVLELLSRYFSKDEFVITSFHPFAINAVKRLCPDIKTGFLFGYGTVDFCRSLRFGSKAVSDRIREMRADFIAPHWELLDTDLLSRVVTGRMPIWVWTVNEASVIEHLLNDSRIEGIITDKPDLGLQLRQRALAYPELV
ncbi:glycerophosphodiester phosphodiesterase [Oscillatoria sp. FACHB-1407]|uniref:glycerophosphodiester phosphodiesterase n=1 Tax=Oscillatoria sp. FACHB-1407 TaxID=2692847 RepID=UPI0016894923|nr:glycerophosphodiester phosphodiesterase [Oscillatoria sp. FACHB-1407]MBD2460105.1 glycerophosphodiester phosphodiesterase [Oscillatoria sp. FACHB-1407]